VIVQPTLRVACAAHDAGGASALVPILAAMRARFGAAVHGCVDGPSAEVLGRGGLNWTALSGTPQGGVNSAEQMRAALERFQPDVVVVATSMGSTPDKVMIRAARSLGIPTIAVLDAWCNYAERFRDHATGSWCENLPDYLLVMDEIAAEEAIDDGIPPEIVEITGHPAYDRLFLSFGREVGPGSAPQGAALRAQPWRVPRRVVFFSEPLSRYRHLGLERGFGETHAFALVLEATQSLPAVERPQVVLRPHPAEPRSVWATRLADAPIPIEIATDGDAASVLAGADLVLGVSTVVLFEAFLLGIPFASLQEQSLDPDPLVLTRHGIVDRVSTAEQLRLVLLKGPPPPTLKRAERMLRWFDGAATERALSRITSVLRRPVSASAPSE
jgi:hypothetical protein